MAKKMRPARAVGDIAGKLLNPVIGQRAGMTTDLMGQWDEIAGRAYANCSRPEKLEWPRSARQTSSFEPATLVVACEGPRAMHLQHESHGIISRANAYFGYQAIKRLRIVQKPNAPLQPARAQRTRSKKPFPSVNIDHMLTGIEDENLRSALKRLGDGVFSRRSDGTL